MTTIAEARAVSDALRPWTITEQSFPHAGSTTEQLEFMLGYAVLAPSGHNTQPWRFRIHDETIHLCADRSRALPVVDPDDRELVISCGAALAHLRLAVRHFGHQDVVELLPDDADPDLLATVRLGTALAPPAEEQPLFDAITTRRCRRLTLDPERAVPEPVRIALRTAVEAHDAWVSFVEDEVREEVAELILAGGEIQGSDPAFRRELAAWLRPNHTGRHDGMPGYAFGFAAPIALLMPFVLAHFPVIKAQAAKDAATARRAPLLVVLGTPADDRISWLHAGQAVATMLLAARAVDVWGAFMNVPIEVEQLRPRLAQTIDEPTQHPQLLLRLGYGSPVPPTPRRAVAEVLTRHPPARGE